MGTATSKRAALATVAAALALAGCGGHSSAPRSTAGDTSTSATAQPAAFAWLRPSAPPSGWATARIPVGAAISYPPAWTKVKGDPGTATAALFGPAHVYVGYLNLTPRQGTETLGNWGRFRVGHNAEEGDRNVRTLSLTTNRPLGGATASCVEDAYTTSTGASYQEIACLLTGRRSSVVAVGAAPPDDWARVAPALERAIASVTA